MSIAYVQDTGTIIATGATAAATFATNPVVGNNIFASGAHSAGGSAATSYTITDSQSNTWATDTAFDTLGDGRHVACVIGNARVATTGASFAVTLTQNGGGASNLCTTYSTYEFSGLASSSPFDSAGSATGNDTAGTTRTSPFNITGGTPAGGNALALMIYCITETGTNLTSLTPQSGFTQNASNLTAALTKVVGALSYNVIANVNGAQAFGESVSPTTPVGSSSSKAASIFNLYKAPTKVIFLSSGTSWLVPSDWNNTANTVECIGTGCSGDASWGGGGGAYAKTTNVTLTAGANASYQIGVPGGTTADNTPGNPLNTWFSSGSTVLAAGAPAGSSGAAGLAANSVGSTTFSGGAGFNGAGGAGGPNGAGNTTSGGSGQNGGAGNAGAAGGGAGGIAGTPNGGNGTYWTSNPGGATAGPGGGGYADTTGGGANGNGGLYGGGGATSHFGGSAGTGQNGFIAITYHPIAVAAAAAAFNLTTTGAGT